MSVTTDHITAYEVTAGPLAGNYRYSALALRSETIINADHAGNVSYYVREGSKVGTGTAVCTVNEGSATTSLVPEKVSTGSEAASAMTEESSLDEDTLKNLKDEMESFSLGFQQEISSPSTILKVIWKAHFLRWETQGQQERTEVPSSTPAQLPRRELSFSPRMVLSQSFRRQSRPLTLSRKITKRKISV